MMNIKNNRKNIAAGIILILSLFVMGITGYKLWESNQIYREANESYDQLIAMVRPGNLQAKTNINEEINELSDELPDEDLRMAVDFAALKTINNDGVAWLYGPGSVIDYPVMQARDYDYYLHHLPNGKYNANGSLFIDYNNASDFSDRLTIIYGHNMNSGRMFGSLTKYKEQSYFDENPHMYLFTEQQDYRIDFVYGCMIAAGEWRDRAFMYQVNTDSLLSYADYHSTFTSGVTHTPDDRVIVLSTCSNDFNDARYILIGILRDVVN